MDSLDVSKAWRVLLAELEFARNYAMAYQLDQGAAVRNPMLENILPSLLHIKMVALLDEALETQLALTQTPLPNAYRSTLEGRISFLSDSQQISNGPALHAIRQQRNDLAHETSSKISWPKLDQDLAVVHATLQHLGFVGARPRFEIKAERSAMQSSQEPGISGYFDYSVSLMEGNRAAAEFKWRSRLHDDELT